ncbi:MAG TPA: glycosyltransferase family A protein [Gemmatimonadaceae bacterium]|nr:glycosyltransferase family A protein [Gemmatimonadaceae bacterium]
MSPEHPYLSVVVPAHNGGAVLRQSLAALAASDLPRECWELIVVDDASEDETAVVAARYADTVVRLPGRPHGPAYARNRGFELCRGENVVFVDADVLVHTDTLRLFAEALATEPDISAVFGSYDDRPPAKGIVSEYRNLLHHYVHHQNAGDAETFWAGCGAIRSGVFLQAGMYDEWHYSRPQIEDIELGHRIRALGHRIVIRPEIQGSHLKRWSLWQVIKTDLNDRGVPWTRLLMTKSAGMRTATLNLRVVEKVNTALVALAWLCMGLALLFVNAAWLLPAALWLLPVLVTNVRLYAFFARIRGMRFALAVIPLNLLYYSLNIVSFTFGWLLHETVGAPRPDPTVEAYAEVGLETWPPVPTKRSVSA